MNKSAAKKILVVEDDSSLAHLLVAHLERRGCEATHARSCAEARAHLKANAADLVLLDIRLPDCSGFDLLVEIAGQVSVIMMTAYGAVDQAVKAVRTGASDYLVKPVSFEALELSIERVFKTEELKRDVAYWQSQAQRAGDGTTIVGSSRQQDEVRRLIELYAGAGSTVLIEGESGVGKEMVARAIHDASDRSHGRFAAVDCDPAQENLLASELFGHERGAFQGAEARREGMLEFANRGTLYLSDIAEVSQALQSKLLRVMETGRFRRLGGAEDVMTDVRIIAATSQDLPERVQQGDFRSELFFRLSAFRIPVPPLRERIEDVDPLARHFLMNRSFQRGIDKTLPPETLDKLRGYDWPGNMRELRNAIERGLIMSGASPRIEPAHVALGAGVHATGHGYEKNPSGEVVLSFDDEPTLEDLRTAYLELLLQRYDGNRRKVAAILGISERNTYRLIPKLKNDR